MAWLAGVWKEEHGISHTVKYRNQKSTETLTLIHSSSYHRGPLQDLTSGSIARARMITVRIMYTTGASPRFLEYWHSFKWVHGDYLDDNLINIKIKS